MRYWIVLFLLLGACAAPYHIPGYELSETIDFRRFEGFVFSTTDLNRDYEPLGVVTITHIPQATRQKSEREAREKSERLKNMYSDGAYLIEQVQVEEVLEKLKKQAQALGAKGVIDLKFEAKLHWVKLDGRNMIVLRGVMATGMASLPSQRSKFIFNPDHSLLAAASPHSYFQTSFFQHRPNRLDGRITTL